MAFPETCAGALDAMKQSASMSLLYSDKCLNHMSDAWAHWNVNQDHLAIEDILYGLSDTNTAAGYAGYGYAPFDYVGPWWWYFTNCITEYELTWQAIVEAWIKDDFAGRMPTIAVIDRMRQILWDEPFYVKWAARPETEL